MSDRASVVVTVILLAALGGVWHAQCRGVAATAAHAQVPVLAPAAPSPWAPADATQLREAKTPRSAWKCGRVLVARTETTARVGQAAVTLPRSCRRNALVLEPYRVVRVDGRDEIWRGADQRLAVLAGSGPPKPTPVAPAVRRTRTTTREWTTWDRRLRATVRHRETIEEVQP